MRSNGVVKRLWAPVVVTMVVVSLSGAAVASPLVDVYIRGAVLSRVPGKNAASVELRWDYKCLGDQLGAATYEWTLKVMRRLPRPERAITITLGTSKTGSRRVQLQPGRYEPLADPFRCQTERGAGSTAAELGAAFVVPDYCAWTVTSARGQVGLEQRGAVRALARGGSVRPGELVFTSGRASLALASRGGGSSLRLAARTRLRLDPSHCARSSGWKFRLTGGSAQVRLAESDRQRLYVLESANAVTSASRASWTVAAGVRGGRPSTRVRVQSGRVTVKSRSGRARILSAGRSTTIG